MTPSDYPAEERRALKAIRAAYDECAAGRITFAEMHARVGKIVETDTARTRLFGSEVSK